MLGDRSATQHPGIETWGAIVYARLVDAYPEIRGVTIRAVNARRGKTRQHERMVTIPTWAANYGDAYVAYYVTHELAHVVAWFRFRARGHGRVYRELENAMLRVVGVALLRARTYPVWKRDAAGQSRPCVTWAAK